MQITMFSAIGPSEREQWTVCPRGQGCSSQI
jgi:hypothetical protein